MQVARRRLTGGVLPNVATAAPGAMRLMAVAGQRLVLEGPTPSSGPLPPLQQLQHIVHLVDVTTGACTAVGAPTPAVIGRAVCSLGGKLLGVGGATAASGKLLLSNQLLHPDLPGWQLAPDSADIHATSPPPRQHAALAYTPRAHAAFLFGGQGEDGCCLNDLWRYDLRTRAWSRLDASSGGGGGSQTSRTLSARPAASSAAAASNAMPLPCHSAGLAVSPDGSRLWVMGGALEGGRCSSALHW